MEYNLNRFVKAQNRPEAGCGSYADALAEVKAGRIEGKWIDYVFPRLKRADDDEATAKFVLKNKEEASLYLANPLLFTRLKEISKALIDLRGKTMDKLFGDNVQHVVASMTLFDALTPNEVYGEVLKNCFEDKRDEETLKLLAADKSLEEEEEEPEEDDENEEKPKRKKTKTKSKKRTSRKSDDDEDDTGGLTKAQKKKIWSSLKRLLGFNEIKRQVRKKTGIPTSRASVENKIGKLFINWLMGKLGIK